MGHEDRFPPTRLSAGGRFRKETIAGMRRRGPTLKCTYIALATNSWNFRS
jgi:hypothetical protein